MNKILKTVNRIKEYGIRYVLKMFVYNRIYRPLNCIIQKACNYVFRKTSLKDIIIIESHNDFDCNGGAFYNYLINNGYNNKYIIVWLLKNPNRSKLPYNVVSFDFFRPSFRKSYYISKAKYSCADDRITDKTRPEQVSFYLGHGVGGLKKPGGKIIFPKTLNYILFQSEQYAPIQAAAYGLEFPDKRLIYLGYPSHDVLNGRYMDEVKKIKNLTNKEYDYLILWMPTFRKGGGDGRNDSSKILPLGIPLIETDKDYIKLDDILAKLHIHMIIKIHPMQDISALRIQDTDNISVLTGETVKKLDIDNYRLMTCVDALISDYSGAAFEFLQVNRPMAYVLSDINDYKLGFVVDDINTLMAGDKIYEFNDMIQFLESISNGIDKYNKERIALRDYIYAYHDCNNCKRLVEFMGLTL